MLVLAEGVVLCVLGGAVGLVIALLLEPVLNTNLAGMLGSFDMSAPSALYALGLATLLGLVIGAYPAVSAKRRTIVDALREH